MTDENHDQDDVEEVGLDDRAEDDRAEDDRAEDDRTYGEHTEANTSRKIRRCPLEPSRS